MKFEILLNGESLDLEVDSTLTVEWISSIFNDSQIFEGSYSYPVVFPITERNKRILKNSHLPENRFDRTEYDVSIIFFGQTWKTARLSYGISTRGFEGVLKIDAGAIAEALRERKVSSVFTISNKGKFVKHVGISIGNGISAKINTIIQSAIDRNAGYPFAFFPVRNEALTGETVELSNSNFKEWLINPYLAGVWQWGGTLHSPYFYLTWVVREICSFLGFTARGDFFENPVIREWVIFNTGVFTYNELQKSDFVICPAKHLPDISISELFKSLRNDFRIGIDIDYSESVIYFVTPDHLLQNSETIDLTGTLSEHSLQIKHNSIKGYSLQTLVDEDDEVYKLEPYVKNYTIGISDNPTSIELKHGRPLMYRGPMNESGSIIMRLPWVRQTGNIYDSDFVDTMAYNPENTYNKNSFQFRLLAFKGFDGYPYATSDLYKPNGTDQYDFGLDPGGDGGYLNTLCRNWYNFLVTSEQVDFVSYMDLQRFTKLSPLRKIGINASSLARLPLLPDRVTIQPASGSDKMVCRILAWAHYNISALQDSVTVEFEEGEVVRPEQNIYVRLVKNNENRVYNNKSMRTRYKDYADFRLYFYRDSAGTLPIAVENLRVTLRELHVDERKGRSSTSTKGPFVCNGTNTLVLSQQMIYEYDQGSLFGGKVRKRWEYSIEPSPNDSYYEI